MLPSPKLLFWGVASGSMNPTVINCSGWAKENPRRTVAFTTVNCVVTPQMPSASTVTARKQNDFSLNKTRRPIRTSCRNDSNIVRSPFRLHACGTLCTTGGNGVLSCPLQSLCQQIKRVHKMLILIELKRPNHARMCKYLFGFGIFFPDFGIVLRGTYCTRFEESRLTGEAV